MYALRTIVYEMSFSSEIFLAPHKVFVVITINHIYSLVPRIN